MKWGYCCLSHCLEYLYNKFEICFIFKVLTGLCLSLKRTIFFFYVYEVKHGTCPQVYPLALKHTAFIIFVCAVSLNLL